MVSRRVRATRDAMAVFDRVGRGRFGDVYRAWDPSLDRDVALRLLRRSRTTAPDDVRVIEEGRLMARVRPPNVITVYGAQRIGGRTGLWMEFIEGRTLEDELRERGPLDARELTHVGVELCRALGAVHGAGLVHRDVKAQNVMREAGGRIVLGDFGTGRQLEEGRADRGELAGTPAYLAPEVFRASPRRPVRIVTWACCSSIYTGSRGIAAGGHDHVVAGAAALSGGGGPPAVW